MTAAIEAGTTSRTASVNTKEMRRILGSSFLGSVIEYYDFSAITAALGRQRGWQNLRHPPKCPPPVRRPGCLE